MDSETISVIICGYTLERWDDLASAVASAQRQTQPAHEVIVVIDGNADLKHRADEELTAAVVLMNTHNPGLSGARQTGAEHATGTILAFLDDDAIADEAGAMLDDAPTASRQARRRCFAADRKPSA